ncbi:MAG: hypothetical protein AAGI90_02695 [Chlamydiota bacterium]
MISEIPKEGPFRVLPDVNPSATVDEEAYPKPPGGPNIGQGRKSSLSLENIYTEFYTPHLNNILTIPSEEIAERFGQRFIVENSCKSGPTLGSSERFVTDMRACYQKIPGYQKLEWAFLWIFRPVLVLVGFSYFFSYFSFFGFLACLPITLPVALVTVITVFRDVIRDYILAYLILPAVHIHSQEKVKKWQDVLEASAATPRESSPELIRLKRINFSDRISSFYGYELTNPDAKPGRYTICYLGNGDLAESTLLSGEMIRVAKKLRSHILVMQQAGVESDAKPNLRTMGSVTHCALNYVNSQADVREVIVHGHSLGGTMVGLTFGNRKIKLNPDVKYSAICSRTFDRLSDMGKFIVRLVLENNACIQSTLSRISCGHFPCMKQFLIASVPYLVWFFGWKIQVAELLNRAPKRVRKIILQTGENGSVVDSDGIITKTAALATAYKHKPQENTYVQLVRERHDKQLEDGTYTDLSDLIDAPESSS